MWIIYVAFVILMELMPSKRHKTLLLRLVGMLQSQLLFYRFGDCHGSCEPRGFYPVEVDEPRDAMGGRAADDKVTGWLPRPRHLMIRGEASNGGKRGRKPPK